MPLVSDPETYVVKTHNLPEDDRFPTIYLVRDGRDCMVSYAWFYLTHDLGLDSTQVTTTQFRETLRDLIYERKSAFGSWSENVNAWLQRAATTDTTVLRFEEFVRNPEPIFSAVERLGLGHRLATAAPPTFESLRQVSPSACRRGEVGSWRDEFPPDLLKVFWEQSVDVMNRLGYEE